MADLCAEPHPERPDITCDKPEPCYGYHANGEHQEIAPWGIRPLPGKRSKPSKVQGIIDNATPEQHTGPPRPSSYFVRHDDPPTAHEAIERYEPKRNTAKGRVLFYLRQHLGVWVDAPVLTQPEIGGFAGTRRLRELRESGWPIETRPKPEDENTWQHRLLPDE